jgi:hypothetical protein
MKQFLFYILLFSVLTSCSNEPDIPVTELYEIRDIGQLSTVEYTIGKIIILEDSDFDWKDFEWTDLEWTDFDKLPKIGERKLLISCKAKVKAGVDLTKIKDGDIKVSGNTIEITLPPAEITSFSMDPNSVRTEMENISGFRDGFTQKEKTEFLQQGEEAIKTDMADSETLDDAKSNVEIFLEDFYKQLGFEQVIISHTTEKK